MKTEHTPTPWKLWDGTKVYGHEHDGSDVSIVDSSSSFLSPETSQANAAFIVRAVNCHEELVALLRECRHPGLSEDLYHRIEKAIAKSEAK